MKLITRVSSLGGAAGFSPAQGLWENPDVNSDPASGERRGKRRPTRRSRRRFCGLLFKGNSLYVRGADGHVYPYFLLRTKHRSKILRLFYSR